MNNDPDEPPPLDPTSQGTRLPLVPSHLRACSPARAEEDLLPGQLPATCLRASAWPRSVSAPEQLVTRPGGPLSHLPNRLPATKRAEGRSTVRPKSARAATRRVRRGREYRATLCGLKRRPDSRCSTTAPVERTCATCVKIAKIRPRRAVRVPSPQRPRGVPSSTRCRRYAAGRIRRHNPCVRPTSCPAAVRVAGRRVAGRPQNRPTCAPAPP